MPRSHPVKPRAWVILAGASILLQAPPARAADGDKARGVEACASASEAAQTLLDAHKPLAAREKLLLCARASCPGVIRRDCEELLSRTEGAIPSIVLSARDAGGHDVTDAQVVLDGAPLLNALQGHAVRLEPGSHVLRLERAGRRVLELSVVAREGEQDRAVLLQLGPLPRAAHSLEAPLTPPEASRSTNVALRVPVVLAGVGAVALGTFAALSAIGQSQYDSCAASGCAASASTSLERERVGAVVALSVGVAASVASVWIFIKRASPTSPDSSAQLGLSGTGSAASLQLVGRF